MLILINSKRYLRTKYLKHVFLIRSLLVAMSFMYVFSPLHSELNILLHKISHNFVIENHHADESIKEDHDLHLNNHKHKFIASKHKKETQDHHHKEELHNHTHELISFINSIFNTEASRTNTNNDLFENKVDKHILTHIIDSPSPIKAYKKESLWYYFSLSKSLKLEVVIPPPQNILV